MINEKRDRSGTDGACGEVVAIEVLARYTAEERTFDNSLGIDHDIRDNTSPGIKRLIDADH